MFFFEGFLDVFEVCVCELGFCETGLFFVIDVFDENGNEGEKNDDYNHEFEVLFYKW